MKKIPPAPLHAMKQAAIEARQPLRGLPELATTVQAGHVAAITAPNPAAHNRT